MTTISKPTDESGTHHAICVFCGQTVGPDHVWQPPNAGPDDCQHCGQPRAKRAKARPTQNDSATIDAESFWSSSQQLTDLRQFAHARMVGRWAMLGNALARVIAHVPPHVVLPPTVGDHASLNLFVAIVGRSGDSKSASMAAAGSWLRAEPDYPPSKPGSGEGLAKCFAYVRKLPASQGGGIEQAGKQWSVLAKIPEVDTLTATAARGGATIMSTLREGWSGERLGTDYAADEKRIVLEANRYRLCLVIGVQPGRAGALFDDAEGGTPQRILWLPSADPDMPETEPDEPPALDLGRWERHAPARGGPSIVPIDVDSARNRLLDDRADPTKFDVLVIPDVAREQIKATRRAVARGDSSVDPLDGHKWLVRLKVAAALMVLERRRHTVTESDWERAGIVMAVSDQTRNKVLAELRDRSSEENANKGYAAGVRDDIAEQTKVDRAESRVAENIVRLLRNKFPGHAGRSNVIKRIAARDRDYFDGAEAKLLDAWRIEKLEAASGARGNGGSDGYILRLKD